MNTANDLKDEFNTRFPKLEDVAAKFLGITDKVDIYRKYNQGKIPFPAFRAFKSQKAPILVDVIALANYLDEQALIADERN
ncbi:Transcription regulator PrtN [uncultured Caudovirales phage]|uniref:Transcription regulator PrtN n=1 Tax=uncultured Caudovirales phage TaxID=2100421 RepID=A0A6J5S4S3_9CAUD|nr:excisionase [uncultured Caudovirales phage]CAB4202726.1 Transcription regulator PrtN [uncultured Caudovirales phage]